MAPKITTMSLNPHAMWPFIAAFLLLPVWLLARASFVELKPTLDLGAILITVVLITIGMFAVAVNVRSSIRAARTKAIIGPGTEAEIAVLEADGGEVVLFASSEAGRQSLSETARRLKAVGEHPGLPRLVRLAEGSQSTQLVLEVGNAQPLTGLHTPSVYAARQLMTAIFEVVERLHGRGYFLGDLPRGSVLVRENGGVALLLAVPPFEKAPSGRASPEVARGAKPEARDDVYSVAVLLVELLTGVPVPLAAGHDPERVLSSQSSLDLAAKRVILGCLGDREDRPATVAEVRTALEETPWRDGLLAKLIERVRALRNDSRFDDLDRRRAFIFLEGVSSPGVGTFSVSLRSFNLLELSFGPPGAKTALLEGSFIEAGSGRVLGTMTHGRVPISIGSIDIRELARFGLMLRTPQGEVHDLTAATVPDTQSALDGPLPELATRIGGRDRDGWLSLIRGRTALALRLLATDALLDVLSVGGEDGGPPSDIETRAEDEVARRLLLRSEHPRPGARTWKWLETILPDTDAAHEALKTLAAEAGSDLSMEERAGSHRRLLDKLVARPGRLRSVAQQAIDWFPAQGHAIPVISAIAPAPGLVSGSVAWLRILPESIVESGRPAVTLRDGGRVPEELARAVARASDLANAILDLQGCPGVECREAPWNVRLAVVPIFVAIALARAERKPLPRQVAIAAGLDTDGRIERIGADVEGVVDAAIASSVRLLLVPQADVEAARRVRADRGLDARDIVFDGLPNLPLPELLQFVEQRIVEHFPSQLDLDRGQSQLVLDRARRSIAAGRPQHALDSLGFLQRTLARKRPGLFFQNLRAVCLAETAGCRKALGQWRLALEAFNQAEAELELLRTGRRLDWSGTELRFDLPDQKAACLLLACAFDVGAQVLGENIKAKTACELVSNASLAKSHGAFGRLDLEWGIASGPGAKRADRFADARAHLQTALDRVDPGERAAYLRQVGLLEAYAGNFEDAEARFKEVESLAGTPVDLEPLLLGRTILDTRRGFGGNREAFARAEALGEKALASHAYLPADRARLVRLVGTSLLESGETSRARARLVSSRELWIGIDTGASLPAVLPDIELARLECGAGRAIEASRRIAESLARVRAYQKQIVGVSPFAEAYVAELITGLERAEEHLADRAVCIRALVEVRERVPY